MDEHIPDQELDIIDAERVIYEANDQMWALVTEFPSQRHSGFEYDFTDEKEQYTSVWFVGKNHGKSRDYILATNKNERFQISFTTQLDDVLSPDPQLTRTVLSIKKDDGKSPEFKEGDDKDIFRVAQLLGGFDVAEVRSELHKTTMQRKQTAGRKIFRRLRK